MKFTPTRIPDVVIIEPREFRDSRGSFMETWNKRSLATGGIVADFVQDNCSVSGQWVLRGLHYQVRRPQGKLVRVARGEVFDVAVDLRRRSPTFGHWVGEWLSESNRRMLWIPPGFAHGFLATGEGAEFLYKCTDYYDPADERAICWDDGDLGIRWPLPPDTQPTVSVKDAAAPGLSTAECYG